MLRSAALQGLEAKCTIGQGSRKLGSISYSPEGPAESQGLGLWEGESGFSEAIESGLNFPRAHMEPLGGLSNHPTAVGVGWATLLRGHRGFHRHQILLMLAHVRPREGPFLSKSQLLTAVFSGQLQPASALSKVCFLTRALAHLFVNSLISSFTHLSPHPCISLLTF